MMSHHVYDPSWRIQGPVQGQSDAGIAGYDGLCARPVLVSLVFADATTGLQVGRRRGCRAAAAAHHRARYCLPLE